MSRPGALLLCETLQRLGVDCAFGLPGSESVELYEALRRSGLRAVTATSELAAAFMANGYARGSGRVGVLATAAGPGFAYALPGLIEARLDSAPLLHLTGASAAGSPRFLARQAIPQAEMAGPVVKEAFRVEEPDAIPDVLARAHALALAREPGPVLVELAPAALHGRTSADPGVPPGRTPSWRVPDPRLVGAVAERLGTARRVAILAGQGAAGAPGELAELAERARACVLATTSGRGTLAEDHPLSLRADAPGAADTLNDLLGTCDVVLALGCKLAHNGSFGFRLRLPPARLVRVDASRAVLEASYPASLAVEADVPAFLRALLGEAPTRPPGSGWAVAELERWRARLERASRLRAEPSVAGLDASAFFAALRRALPRDGCLVSDAGLHELLARRHFAVLAPRGLVVPADFHAMGFAIPAAIGAALAAPGRAVAAVVGDGGFAISGLELLTAVRERVALTAIVFADGQLGLIRRQQLGAYGREHAVGLRNPDFGRLAEAIGAAHVQPGADVAGLLAGLIGRPGVALVDVPVVDRPGARALRLRGAVRAAGRRARP